MTFPHASSSILHTRSRRRCKQPWKEAPAKWSSGERRLFGEERKEEFLPRWHVHRPADVNLARLRFDRRPPDVDVPAVVRDVELIDQRKPAVQFAVRFDFDIVLGSVDAQLRIDRES